MVPHFQTGQGRGSSAHLKTDETRCSACDELLDLTAHRLDFCIDIANPARHSSIAHPTGRCRPHPSAQAVRTFADARVVATAPITPLGAARLGAFDRGPDANTQRACMSSESLAASATMPRFERSRSMARSKCRALNPSVCRIHRK